MRRRRTLRLGAMLAALILGSAGRRSAALTLTVERRPLQQMTYGMDFERLWFWYGKLDRAATARLAVVDCDLHYLRVAIHPGYELEEGQLDPGVYDRILEMMQAMRAADPHIRFFGSPRPLNDSVKDAPWCPYPLWINEFKRTSNGGWSFVTFHWDKAADYLVRYIRFMQAHGLTIDYLDVTNEWNHVTPALTRKMQQRMAAQLGPDMPLLIAPSAWSYAQGAAWLREAEEQGALDGFTLAASHNTGRQGTAETFAAQARQVGKPVIWDSELHGWKGVRPEEEIPASRYLWDCVRAGFSGIDSWLALGTTQQKHCLILNEGGRPTPNVKYHIFRTLTTTSNYGFALPINRPAELTSTAAFSRNGALTVWVLNDSPTPQADVEVVVSDRRLDGPVARIQWQPALPITGVVTRSDAGGGRRGSALVVTGDDRFRTAIEGNSLSCFQVRLQDSLLPPGWVLDNLGDPSAGSEATYDAVTETFILETGARDGRAGRGIGPVWPFVYRELEGDGMIAVRVDWQGTPDAATEAGLMLRTSLASDAAQVGLALNAAEAAVVRTGDGAEVPNSTGSRRAPRGTWLRLLRLGGTCTAFRSDDGLQWHDLGSRSFPRDDSVLAGLYLRASGPARVAFSRLGGSPGLSPRRPVRFEAVP